MTRRLSHTYDHRQAAERVRERLVTIGADPDAVTVTDERAATGGPGLFDKLAELIAPAAAGRPRWLLTAEIAPELFETAQSALDAGQRWTAPEGRLEARTYVFRETRERLVIEKEPVVREEVVLTPRTEHRTEQVHDTVRRMDADVERLEPAPAGSPNNRPR